MVTGPPLVGKSRFTVDVLERALADGRDVLLVTAARSAPRVLADHDGDVRVIDCTPAEATAGDVVNVNSPADLTGISMPVSRFLSDADDPVLVLDSVSALLMYTDNAPAFRFLSVLTTHVRRANGLGLFTFDDGTHPEQTVKTFTQLFDGRVQLRDGPEGRDLSATGVPSIPEGWQPLR